MSCRRAAGKESSSEIKHLVLSFLCSSRQHADCGGAGLARRLSKPNHEAPIGSPVIRPGRNVSCEMRLSQRPARNQPSPRCLKPTNVTPTEVKENSAT